jgi:concanavalin A-like lectin/glucanase superfamily protein
MKIGKIAFTFVVLLLGARGALAQDRYVSTTGSDSNDGTAPDNTHAWLTIQHAADMSQAGMTIHVAPGTYTVTTQITSSNSGTSDTNRIVFISDERWGSQIVGSSGVGQIWSNAGDYVDIIGFDISGTSSTSGGIHAQANHDRAIGNRIHDISQNTCQSGAGILLGGGASNQSAIGNIIYNIGPLPPAVPGCNQIHGIYAQESNSTVENNLTFNIAGKGLHIWGDRATNDVISNNTSFNNQDGIIVGNSGATGVIFDNSIISNNISYGNVRYGIYEGTNNAGDYSSIGTNNQFLNNLVYANCVNQATNDYCDPSTGPPDLDLPKLGTLSGTVTSDPQFVSYTGAISGDYHLKSTSSAINAGISTGTPPSQDFDGTPRPLGGAYDIGAYEFDSRFAAWWKFDNNDTTDSSGNGNTGTLTCYGTGCTNPGYGAGKVGSAISLDGISQFVSVPDSASLDMTDNITVAFWINASTASSPGPRVVSKNYSWDVKLNAGYPQFTSGSYYAALSSTITANTWVHIAFTYASTSQTPLAAYVNGVQVTSFQTNNFPQNYLFPSSMYGVNIGADSDGTGNFFPGLIDEVRIYNRVLSSSEISALYSSYGGSTGGGTCSSAPLAPSGLSTNAGNGQVSLSWNASSCATSYNIYRSQTSGHEASPATASTSATSYTDSVTNNEPYYYVVTAVNSFGESPFSNEAGPAIPTAGLVSATTCGTIGQGSDDRAIIQQCLNQTAAAGQTLEIPAGTYNLGPLSGSTYSITFPNNGNMHLDSGVTIAAVSSYNCGQVMFLFAANNVTLSGAGSSVSAITMQAYQPISACEGSHILRFDGASNATVQSLTATHAAGGDAIYIRNSTNVTVNDSVFDSAYRNGASVTGAVNHVFFNRDTFQNTTGCFNGSCFTDVGGGTDIEPNSPSEFLLDLNYTDCNFNNNYNDGVRISLNALTSSSQAVGITFLRAHTNSNGRYGYVAINDDSTNGNPTGTINVNDSSSGSSSGDGSTCAAGRFWTGDGPTTAEELIFSNFSCTNPHQKGDEPVNHTYSAVGSFRGGGGVLKLGNIHFYGTNISITDGKTHDYFEFQDASSPQFSYNVEFDSKGSMSGATQVPPNGHVLTQGCSSVSLGTPPPGADVPVCNP